MSSSPRAGYTLPVFACAAAIAGLQSLQDQTATSTIAVNLVEPAEVVEIAIEQVARLSANAALAITRSDPGDNLDLTRHTPIWALVEWGTPDQAAAIEIFGGEGIGRSQDGQAAIYRYAKRLLLENLTPRLRAETAIRVTIILPEGRSLAQRTSNAAFGVVDGLSLLGTTGIAQPLSAPGQLAAYREELQQKAQQFDCLVFCVGENGLDLGQQLGMNPAQIVKTANWVGPLLVEASLQGVRSILLFGYHGKLLKLAGGIFHTHHHVADARLEIFTSHCAIAGLPTADLRAIFACPTTDEALHYLQTLDQQGSQWTTTVYGAIAQTIDQRTQKYIHAHSAIAVAIGTVLFDRRRKIIVSSQTGAILLKGVCSSS
ncbi:MAG: cobalt-precorrin-5B (C(1))-methyltransferase CbiD [Leptolyngbyaceae cyanobacterium bins.349]|nr:cobalt-precorrin-5B (C(1))-methyltransferase CbiD [Leptolyngbyaceae cyanobacterium bins.349]